MKRKITILLAILVVAFVIKTLLDAGVFKTLKPHSLLRDVSIYNQMAGTEDLALDRKNGLLFISSSDRWNKIEGSESKDGIYLLDLEKGMSAKPIKLNSKINGAFHPHGISFLRKNEKNYLFAINHFKSEDSIEVFEYKDNQLIHLKTYKNEQMCCPNDLVAVDVDKFYVTNDHGNTSKVGRVLEDYLKLPNSYVLYFDGETYSKVVERLSYANGINISNNGEKLYVTEVSGQKITVMDRDLSTGQLSFQFAKQIDTGLDNISIDEDDNLWIGSHPKLLAFVSHSKDASKFSPSQVLKLKLEADDFKVEEIYLNDGEQISASSVAVKYKNEIFIGVVFESKLLRGTLDKE